MGRLDTELTDEQMKEKLKGKYMTYKSARWVHEMNAKHPDDVSILNKAMWEYDRAVRTGMIQEGN